MFKDAKNRTFDSVLVLPTVTALRKLGVNLSEELPVVIQSIQSDPELLANVLWTIHQDSAKSNGVTEEEFGKLLDGNTLATAVDSLIDAIVNFSHPATRAALRKLVEKGREVEVLAAQKMEAAVEALSAQTILSGLKNSVGNSPVSPASTPQPEPSDNSGGAPEPSDETNGTAQANSSV